MSLLKCIIFNSIALFRRL